ncbi:carboxymuconolactone decarboxylase family protein [Dongshaea marina]|uniref:carboxymuconolactone decarboxylase family protein n=1 Tax=Dongshaea marina TaxID=2047966 RepID=UPI000D3E8397|nr:carboxymuconolactone decarboxylase family protein [Dongshaea marina]
MLINPKPLKSYPWWLKPFFWSQQRRYGQVLKPGLLWARIPKLFAAVALLYGVLDRKRSPIDPVLRSLVTVRVSQINWCSFCVDINGMVLMKRAGSEAKVEALSQWRESELFDDKERAVLDYVEAVTYSDRQVSPAQLEVLKGYFDEDAVVELTGLIAFQNLSSKFNAALDVPAEGFCKVPLADDFKEKSGD